MYPIKLNTPTIENIDLPNYDIIHDVTSRLFQQLQNKLEIHITEGLKRKGFEFGNKIELYKFVKRHCKVEDNIDVKERVYFVKNIPFFLHNYNTIMDFEPLSTYRKMTMSANLGSYAYL